MAYDPDVSSLLAFVETLLSEPSAKAAFAAAPDDFLARHGFVGLEPEHVAEALHHAADTFPPRLAAEVLPGAGFGGIAEVDLAEIGLAAPGDFSAMDAGPPGWPAPLATPDVDFDIGDAVTATLDSNRAVAVTPNENTAGNVDALDAPAAADTVASGPVDDAGAADPPVDAAFADFGRFDGAADPFTFDSPAIGQHEAAVFDNGPGFDAGGGLDVPDVAETDDLDDF